MELFYYRIQAKWSRTWKRSALDSYYLWVVNAKHISISLLFRSVFCHVGGMSLVLSTDYICLVIGFVLVLLLLSILTLIDMKKMFKNA